VIRHYEDLTGRGLEHERIDLLRGVLLADDPAHVADVVPMVADWAARHRLDGRSPGALERSSAEALHQPKAEP
jgi:hypothetical protein